MSSYDSALPHNFVHCSHRSVATASVRLEVATFARSPWKQGEEQVCSLIQREKRGFII